MKNTLTDFIVYSFIVGGIFVLSRPGGNGPLFIKNLTHGYASVVQASTGQTVTA